MLVAALSLWSLWMWGHHCRLGVEIIIRLLTTMNQFYIRTQCSEGLLLLIVWRSLLLFLDRLFKILVIIHSSISNYASLFGSRLNCVQPIIVIPIVCALRLSKLYKSALLLLIINSRKNLQEKGSQAITLWISALSRESKKKKSIFLGSVPWKGKKKYIHVCSKNKLECFKSAGK